MQSKDISELESQNWVYQNVPQTMLYLGDFFMAFVILKLLISVWNQMRVSENIIIIIIIIIIY